MQSTTETPDICRPAAYEVWILGALDDTWATEYAALNIKVEHAPGRPVTTTLVGTLKDQADLIGLLTRLFDLGYPILYVEYVPAQAAAAPPEAAPPVEAAMPEYMIELQQLAQLKDQGVITQEEFDAKKKRLLG